MIMKTTFDLTKEEMKAYGYKIIDILAEHFDTIESKKPVSSATRKEMDAVFLQEAPEHAMPANQVLDFVMENVIPYSNLTSHPKMFSFVPGPSNYISTLADTLATGFNRGMDCFTCCCRIGNCNHELAFKNV
jgi:aromatic-L-amino-acid/L-tryptophan decarboxylase